MWVLGGMEAVLCCGLYEWYFWLGLCFNAGTNHSSCECSLSLLTFIFFLFISCLYFSLSPIFHLDKDLSKWIWHYVEWCSTFDFFLIYVIVEICPIRVWNSAMKCRVWGTTASLHQDKPWCTFSGCVSFSKGEVGFREVVGVMKGYRHHWSH